MLIPPVLLLLTLALPPHESLELAARWQAQGHYAAAAAIYDFLAWRRPTAGEFYLNQGNVHTLAGNLPQAILAYRRAEARMPSNPTLQENLAESRSRVIDSPGSPRTCKLPRFAPGSYGFAWALLIVWITLPRRWLLCVACATLAGSLCLFAWLVISKWDNERQPFAVVAGEVILRKGNGPSYPPVEVGGAAVRLHPGAETSALAARRNGWVQIELATGVVGWVPRAQVLLDHELE